MSTNTTVSTTENTAVKAPAKTASVNHGKNPVIDAMFKVGAHYGFIKSRRHPTVKPFIFGTKNTVEIFDLEKTDKQLALAMDFVNHIKSAGKQILFVSSKSEAKNILQRGAESCGEPYVAGRWVGGTFTNFEMIRRRVDKLLDLTSQKEKGELGKYTKKERLLIDREIARLQNLFGGIVTMKSLPGAIFVIDAKKEHIAVAEANDAGVPVIALTGSDNDISTVKFPIVANDSSVDSIAFFIHKIAEAVNMPKKAVADSK
jgi:small subunit ribosomal protein S2